MTDDGRGRLPAQTVIDGVGDGRERTGGPAGTVNLQGLTGFAIDTAPSVGRQRR